jgi:protein-disulfide isomerase
MKRAALAFSCSLLIAGLAVAGCGSKQEAPPLSSGPASSVQGAGTPSAPEGPSAPSASARANAPAQGNSDGPTPATDGAPRHTSAAGGVVSGAQGKLMDPASLPAEVRGSGDNSQNLAARDVAAVDGKIRVIVYQDPMCPYCKQFDDDYGRQLDAWADDGDIVVDHRVISFLDQMSTTEYSTRASNALACVADGSPDAYTKYLRALYTAQDPRSEGGLGVTEGGPGLSDEQLGRLAEDAGASDEVKDCISSLKFASWVRSSTSDALSSGVKGTPTVIVDGQLWNASADADFEGWAKKIISEAK